MDRIGDDHTSVKMISRGLVDVMLESEKESLWLLLIMQSEQGKLLFDN